MLQSLIRKFRKPTVPQQVFLLWAVPLIFLLFFFFYPLGAVFSLAGKAAFGQDIAINVETRIWRPLAFTIWQALLSTGLTLLLGLPAAYLFARFRFPGKKFLRTLTTLPFILPTVVVAVSFNALIGPRGWLNIVLMKLFDLSSPPIQIMNTLLAILLAHVFYNVSIVIRTVGSAWSQLDVRMEHAARVLGASPIRVFREVTLPLLKAPIAAAALLVFLFDFTSFGVILLLGGPRFATLEVEIYIQALQMLNLPLSGLLSAIQMICTLLVLIIYTRTVAKQNIPLMPRMKGEGERNPQKSGERIFVAVMVVILIVLQFFPLGALILRSMTTLDANRGVRGAVDTGFTLAYYQELFINRRQSLFYVPPIEAIWNSLFYASITVVLSVGMGFLVAYALNNRTLFNRILDPLLMLPLGTSAVTLGLGFIIVFNQPPVDVRSFPLLMPIAHSLVALPFVVRTLQPALSSIPNSLRHAAAAMGASPWRVWLEVDLPILARAVVVGAIFSFTISLGEFGATTFLSRPETPTMPVAIFRFISQPGALNYGQALAMSTLLMIVCAIGILVMDYFRTEI